MSLDFYQDQPHTCSYLEGHLARNIYPDPSKPMDKSLYTHLIKQGFRRSGNYVYRPYCPQCHACIPVRIDVDLFRPNRSQRRCLRKNQDIAVKIRPVELQAEHFELYRRYQSGRHAGGGMDNQTIEAYINFISSNWCDTSFLEFKLDEKLVAIAVTDFVTDAASAFYTFFDLEYAERSLGIFAILKQIELAKSHGLSWLYLGYWIEECRKMRYKRFFSALETYHGQWQSMNKNF